jgi:hypothetical protein
MSESNANPPGEQPGPGDRSWNGLPDVPWYTPEDHPPPSYGQPYQSAWPRASVPLVNKPKSNMVSAILVTLFCCLPLGIVAIAYAAKADARWNVGDWQGAERAARSSRNWVLAGVVGGVVVYLIYFIALASADTTSLSRF